LRLVSFVVSRYNYISIKLNKRKHSKSPGRPIEGRAIVFITYSRFTPSVIKQQNIFVCKKSKNVEYSPNISRLLMGFHVNTYRNYLLYGISRMTIPGT
jgi:hypothetical protein